MIVDASAVLAVLVREPEATDFMRAFAAESEHSISPVNYLEACMRLMKRDEDVASVDELMALSNIRLADVTADQTYLARQAYARFGKGNHEARLNLGDCFAYALAKARGEPLLFKGDDFRKTDVEAAL
ncbi:type II toxin-antitoxin system VapC family toxin [Nitratireductor mangrovi]|uniref:Ribonuclease VapC n=1 Tax=Nitratireductor mangrovi TaxID=2599600 RepID=A0A5B8L062_9HYPH|nr:type II toxin-antitoxin system VapC family toxin [Nitratireductor mangrovi]QDZ01233.1 type II toxin-antitoxin system VapC family toxin [Nitratireductor mangrovi]